MNALELEKAAGKQGQLAFRLMYVDMVDGDLYSVTTNVNISAVPEPETSALMLAGLGLLHVVVTIKLNNSIFNTFRI